jgi:hypothetical protein
MPLALHCTDSRFQGMPKYLILPQIFRRPRKRGHFGAELRARMGARTEVLHRLESGKQERCGPLAGADALDARFRAWEEIEVGEGGALRSDGFPLSAGMTE